MASNSLTHARKLSTLGQAIMRFAIISATLLAGASTTLALPADKRDECCCCDANIGAIICQQRDVCVCKPVGCPEDAPTIWINGGLPARLFGIELDLDLDIGVGDGNDDTEGGGGEDGDGGDGDDGSSEGDYECCCCDASQPAIVCNFVAGPEECFCPAIACPTTAPTIPATPAPPTPTPTTDPELCCCCNPGAGAIVCSPRDPADGCICPLVMCPSGAPTVIASTEAPAYTG